MSKYKNEGFDPEEIKLLKEECKEAGTNFVYSEPDEDEDSEAADNQEFAQVQFVGKYKNEEVIFDTIFCTLRLHHSGLVYEKAVEEVKKIYPKYLTEDERDAKYKIDAKAEEEIEEILGELMDGIEDDEEIKVSEHYEFDTDFEYGVGLEVCLNVEKITSDVIENFIKRFNDGTLKLDNTLYSFVTEDEDED